MSTTESQIGANASQKPAVTREELREMFREFSAKKGGEVEGGTQLMADNYIIREDKRRLTEEVEQLRQQVPPQGSLVLKGESVKLHNDLKAAMELLPEAQRKPEEVVRLLKEHADLTKKVADLEKGQLAVQIAEAEGWKVSALLRLTKDMDLIIEEVDVEVDDDENEGKKKTVKQSRGFVQSHDASGAVTGKKALREELKDFLPSLSKAEIEGGSEEEQAQTGESGTPFVRQSQGGKASSSTKSASQDYINKKYKKPSDKK